MPRNNWTREELILTFNLYLKIPFGKFHHGNKEVIELASLIHRTPSAVAMRLSNFASVDPYHQKRGISGLRGGIAQVQPIWDEFNENKEDMIFESEKILAQIQKTTIENKYSGILNDVEKLVGESKIREVKTRINQNVFRQIVLANYTGKCAITGFSNTSFLIASHIIPWSVDKNNRLNPQNGILLNSLHDRAFENGFMAINNEFQILICTDFLKSKDIFVQSYFSAFHKRKIEMPIRFLPDTELLEKHFAEKFLG